MEKQKYGKWDIRGNNSLTPEQGRSASMVWLIGEEGKKNFTIRDDKDGLNIHFRGKVDCEESYSVSVDILRDAIREYFDKVNGNAYVFSREELDGIDKGSLHLIEN